MGAAGISSVGSGLICQTYPPETAYERRINLFKKSEDHSETEDYSETEDHSEIEKDRTVGEHLAASTLVRSSL